MNTGFFSFPASSDPTLIDIKEFDVSGVYVIPRNAKLIKILAVGSGGGGGGGGRTASGAAAGGGGGGGGGLLMHDFRADDLGGAGTSLQIVIGAAGTGGAGA